MITQEILYFIKLTASTVSSLPNVTNPKPRDFPVAGSVLIVTSVTSPNFEKNSFISSTRGKVNFKCLVHKN